ncbi:MAG: F0F1 ATP synthase subunit gamma [Sneathiella sp.]|jgi:F-type H+-transporting ATPase subunit gamma|uniref:F0F1 ATP synthase subunit gamma n=1 Tax=Sneathiella sp. TaxID=1964365 RepID=UPI000C4EAA42|nr:F0F1 ATP synthase subunit gamma [Sneathiella sp.]MAL78942.1 F0F1 ATP synthase subunit gamma [Sneathiella sp.]|tara:strand:+ start:529 stop:1407 length:879 start_codon:yes stop_codon:yes gene_type:complete
MANLKELKNRISSVTSTQKITKAMKMVAAAKLRHAEEAANAARPYAERMDSMMASLASGMVGKDNAPKLLAGTGSDQRQLIIVATGERGLCGGFNSSISKAAALKVDKLLAQGKDVKILCVGKKGRDVLKRKYSHLIIGTVDLSGSKRIGFDDAQPIAQRVLTMFDADEFDVCTIFYAKFVSVLTQTVTEQQIIPAPVPEKADAEESDILYEYEPEEEEILAELLPRNLSVQIFRALLENSASEQGARMSAMDNATRNAGEMIDKLTLQYNRERQAAITSELIEIISGAEAL